MHLMGLLSDAGVHSAMGHLRALVTLARRCGVRSLYVHAFTDGRDTSPTAGEGYAEGLQGFLIAEGLGAIATVSGRYYAMDRDKRWDRVKLAYDALVAGVGPRAPGALAAIRESYARDETDEFILSATEPRQDSGNRNSDGAARDPALVLGVGWSWRALQLDAHLNSGLTLTAPVVRWSARLDW